MMMVMMMMMIVANPNRFSQDAHLSNGSAVQVIGKVNPDLSIRVLSSLDLGTGVGKVFSLSCPFIRSPGRDTRDKGAAQHTHITT